MMPVLKGKKFFFLIIIFFFLTTYHSIQKISFPFFKINKVEIVNSIYLEENIKNKVIDYNLNKSLLTISKSKIKYLLSESNWIKNFSLKKKYPNKIIIQVQEFRPIALFLNRNDFFFINENFNLTNKKINYYQFKTYPIYTGKFNKESFLYFYNFLVKFDFLHNVKEIKYNSYNQWELYTKKDLKILFGDYSFEKQFKILRFISNKNQKINLIDLRLEDRAVIS